VKGEGSERMDDSIGVGRYGKKRSADRRLEMKDSGIN
jgi:hypothetical protein